MSPKQCRVPASTATTVKMKQVEREQGRARDTGAEMRKRIWEVEGERSTADAMGEEGRRAHRGRVCQKDKAKGGYCGRHQRLPASVAMKEP